MPQLRINGRNQEEVKPRDFTFTVVYLPVGQFAGRPAPRRKTRRRRPVLRENLAPKSGYQVTVPLLPGLVTYGRTLSEAREMARDAIRCHLEGLRKAGEPIPNERLAHKDRVRIALSA
jgi:predicted RNase H-like HicB family nuclease